LVKNTTKMVKNHVFSGQKIAFPPDTIRESEILVHVTCQTQKITEPSKVGFDLLAQETLVSERSDACVARVDATLSMVK